MPYNRTAPDYAKAQQQFRSQKSGLTRALNSKDPAKVIATCTKTVKEWDETGIWPDAWHRWNIALGDAYNWARLAYIEGNGPQPDSLDYELESLRNR